jgi:hypothetical protein
MYRVFAIVVGALALGACSSTPEFGNLASLDLFKSGPTMDTVRFESEPPGAEAKASNGQTCRTPCALALPAEQPMTITFALTGYETQTQQIEVITGAGEPPRLRPNPVIAELTAAPAPKPVAKKKPAKKPAPKPTAATPKPAATAPAAAAAAPAAPAPAAPAAAAPAPAPAFGAPPPAAASPWPATPAQR